MNERAARGVRPRLLAVAFLGCALMWAGTGCAGYVARRLAQAPNTFPQWLAPRAPVVLDFGANFLTNFPATYLEVGPPAARLRYRLVEPGDYRVTVTSSNWTESGRPRFKFTFTATVPGNGPATNSRPRGTVILLHGYGISQAAMAPWALRLAQEGWRCVLVDLRGHGKSTGDRISYGLHEANDLSQLLDTLQRQGHVTPPVAVLGQSYGAAMALRWQTLDPRIHGSVVITPYADLGDSVLNIRREYAAWIPEACIRAGFNKLPDLLGTEADELNPVCWLKRKPVRTLFVVGDQDKITPITEVCELQTLALPGSPLVIVPRATHETVPFMINELVPPVLEWLKTLPEATAAE